MKKLIFLLILCSIAWYYTVNTNNQNMPKVNEPNSTPKTNYSSSFQCDGRTYCSQMNSCEEATFFLNNCPNVKMDGNNDGVPCEKQWCN